jgi:energy-coupling factor transporter ATP-binding protein EcfA2
MSTVDSIIDTQKFSDWIGLQTKSSHKCFNKQVAEWADDSKKLNSLSNRFKRFKEAFRNDSEFYPKCQQIFKEISECEKEINNLTNTDSKLERESYNEILFFRPLLQPLNFIPHLLSSWAFIRVYLLPGLSFIIPFLTLLAPYIILRFAFNVPMTFNNYMNILHSMVAGNFQKVLDPTVANQSSSGISPINFIKQFGVVIVTFIQGIIQPYWSYKHLKSIDDIITEKGRLVIRFRNLYYELQTILSKHGFNFFKCPIPDIRDERDATANVILQSSYFNLALKYIGSLEVIMALASKEEINPVLWVKSDTPIFRIRDTFDFQVPYNNRKTISANFDSNTHALLTGPNKGGKSTVLRALSISALLAHTYGCAPGYLTLTSYTKMFVCLKPDDLPGSKSRFEREIEFTANTLKFTEPILVFIDELYHSTNPPDALRSCNIYCQQLWKKNNIVSVISTHLFELVENADNNIQKLCCPARIDKDGDIYFDYSLKKGICKVSSVDELLKNNGLMHKKCAPENS